MPRKYIKVKNRIAARVPDSSSSTGSTEADGERAPTAIPSADTAPPPKRTTPPAPPTVQAPSLPAASAPNFAVVNGDTPNNSPEEGASESPRVSVPPTNASRDGGGTPLPMLIEEHPPTSDGSSPVDVTPHHLKQQQPLPRVLELQGIPPPGHLQQGPLIYGPGGLPRVLNKPGYYHSTTDSTACQVLPDGQVVWFDRRLKYPGVPGAPYPMPHQHIQKQANRHQQMQRAPGPPVFPPHRAPGVPGGSHARPPTPRHPGQPLVPVHPQFYGQRLPPGHPYPRLQGHPNAVHYAMPPPSGQAHPHPQGLPPSNQSQLHLAQYVPMRPEQMLQRVPDPRAPRMSLPGTPIAQTPPPAQRSSSTVPPASAMAPGQPAERMSPSTPNKDLSEQVDNDIQRRRRRRTENNHEQPASVIEEETPAGVPGAPYSIHQHHMQQQQQASGHQQMQQAPGPPVFPPHRAPGVPGGSHVRASPPSQVAPGQPLVPGHPQFYGQRLPPGHPDPRSQGLPNAMHYAMLIPPPNGQAQHPHPQGPPQPHQPHLVQYVPMRPEQMHQRVPDPRAPRMSLPGTPIAQTPPPAQRSSSTVAPASAMAPGQPAERMPPSTPNKDLSEQVDNDTAIHEPPAPVIQERPASVIHERPASVIEIEPPAANPNPRPTKSTERVVRSSPSTPILLKNPTSHDGDSKTSGFPVETLNPHFILEYCKNEMATLRLEKDTELQRRMAEMEHEHKKEIDLMKARYSAILTEKDNFIDTLRKYNQEYDDVLKNKNLETFYLTSRVKELESAQLASLTLVESLEEQRLRAQLKDQALTTEINKLQSARWRQEDERENGVEHRIHKNDETLKSDYEEALKNIDSLQSELEKVRDDRDAVKEKLALKEEQLKAYEKAKTDGKDDNELREENVKLKIFIVRARKLVKELTEGEEEEDMNSEKLLDEARVEEFFAWLRIANYTKAAKEFMATLIMKQKEMVETFRVSWNDAIKLAMDIGKLGSNVKFEMIKHMVDALIKLFTDTKDVYQNFSQTSNRIGRKRKVQETSAERLTLDLKRMRNPE